MLKQKVKVELSFLGGFDHRNYVLKGGNYSQKYGLFFEIQQSALALAAAIVQRLVGVHNKINATVMKCFALAF